MKRAYPHAFKDTSTHTHTLILENVVMENVVKKVDQVILAQEQIGIQSESHYAPLICASATSYITIHI